MGICAELIREFLRSRGWIVIKIHDAPVKHLNYSKAALALAARKRTNQYLKSDNLDVLVVLFMSTTFGIQGHPSIVQLYDSINEIIVQRDSLIQSIESDCNTEFGISVADYSKINYDVKIGYLDIDGRLLMMDTHLGFLPAEHSHTKMCT